MKSSTLLLVIITCLICFSCKEEAPKAKLKIDKTELKFNKTNKTNSLLIANIGDAELKWHLYRLPQWLKAHPTSGSIMPGAKEVTFTTENISITDLPECNIDLETNAGDVVVDVKLSIKLLIPGNGTKKIYIDQTYQSLKETMGEPDFIQFVKFDKDDDYYFEVCIYSTENVYVYFKTTNPNNPAISDNLIEQDNTVNMIQFLYPNDVTTKDWIGLGSTIAEVQAVFGNTDYFDWYLTDEGKLINYHGYPEKGIEFYFVDNNYLSVSCVNIFKPYTPSNIANIKPEIQQARFFLPTLKSIVK